MKTTGCYHCGADEIHGIQSDGTDNACAPLRAAWTREEEHEGYCDGQASKRYEAAAFGDQDD